MSLAQFFFDDLFHFIGLVIVLWVVLVGLADIIRSLSRLVALIRQNRPK